MSFAVFADGSANLPKSMLEGISLLPCDYTVDGEPYTYWGDVDSFDVHPFYEGLRNGTVVRTTLLNTSLFLSRFAPILTQGIDIIYISMSSGISGTYNAARIAAQELMDLYSGRFVHIVDSLGCGFGNGLLAVRAAKLSREGVSAREAAAILDQEVPHTCQGSAAHLSILHRRRPELPEEHRPGQRHVRQDRNRAQHQADPLRR